MSPNDPTSKRELIAELLRRKLASQSLEWQILPRQEDVLIPLSFSQERLWFLEQFSPDSRAYNRPAHIRFTGMLDVDSLERTLNHIVKRHEVLRTCFLSSSEGPVQVIRPDASVVLPRIDLSDLNSVGLETEARRLAIEETLISFDLSSGPLLRAKLLRLDPQQHILLLTFHHIAFDGWSQSILLGEISTLYQTYTTGQKNTLSALPVQYADFAIWQRQRLSSERFEKSIRYWRQQLNDYPNTLSLPTDRPRPRLQSYSGGHFPLDLSGELLNQLKLLSSRHGSTLFITLLTAFVTLLFRYSGQTDISVGFPVAGRTHSKVENLIGFFINTLVLRADLSGAPTLSALLSRVHKLAMQAYEHQELPFERLVEELEVERDLSRSPLFQVFFQLRNYPRQVLQLNGLQAERFEVDVSVEKFDLFIDTIEEENGGLRCLFRYNVDLFDHSSIVQMAGHFRRILETLITAPTRSIAHLDLLSPAERKQLFIEWNDTYKKREPDAGIHQGFEAQVLRFGDKTAVSFSGEKVTYRQLNERANQLAHHLSDLGLKPGTLVGLFMDPSPDMMVGLLAILKAGAAFVPLDPWLPRERLSLLLDGVTILLSRTGLLKQLPDHSAQVVDLQAISMTLAKGSKENPERGPSGGNLAYVIYTSGSTGRPKGVMIEHAAFMNLLGALVTQLSFSENDVLLSITNLSFDIGVLEVLLPLSAGAQLRLVSREIATDARRLMQELEHSPATVMMGTPATWRMLIDSGWQGKEGLTMICGGEALPSDLARQLLERGKSLWNMYGPTETTVFSTTSQIRPGLDIVPIGRPIDNTQCYVLDSLNEPVPLGVPGQLFIGGAGLARGYWKQPDQTAESFVANPYTQQPGKRMYATGDLVRWRSWGEIEFLGRIDHQLKVRGFRIEPAEIEAVVKQHPLIRDCVVIGREDIPGDRRLIAYLVPVQSPTSLESAPADIPWGKWEEEQVSQWESIWNQTFSAPPESIDPTCNTAGVISSYTGEPIPADETRDWVEHAARRVLRLKPDCVLDIGCGLGRTLFRVAPQCSKYWGVDFAQPALDYVKRHLHLLESSQTDIRFIQAAADDLWGIGPAEFDVVILNGVVMYFPGVDYLVDVIENALRITAPGGYVFIGDVRSLPLLEAFHLSVALYGAGDDLALDQLWQGVQKRASEEELLVDPEFFRTLKDRFPTISQVEIHLKRGRAHNELTRFRYDVVLQVHGNVESPRKEATWLDWKTDALSVDAVRRHLLQAEPEALGIREVPNTRVLPEVDAVKNRTRETGNKTAKSLRTELEETRKEAFDPEAFWSLSDELPYVVDITWSTSGGPDLPTIEQLARQLEADGVGLF